MKNFSELDRVLKLTRVTDPLIKHFKLQTIDCKHNQCPIIGFQIGTDDPSAPCLGLFGGVHGIEKIGTHVVLAYLSNLFKQLEWDQDLRNILQTSRIISIPLINPGGMSQLRRANPNGVDLMRNSPVELNESESFHWPVSGQRLTNKLSWYRGKKGSPLEVEVQTTIEFIQKFMFQSSVSLAMDFHSGFGLKDRLWCPYGKTREKFPRYKEAMNIKSLLDSTLPYHIYTIEPQSDSYMIKGDLWDYLFDLHHQQENQDQKCFIPWTLEMGSWIWVKKNPIQLFQSIGMFNPMKAHRYNRTMRRHLLLIDFMFKMTRNKKAWT